MMIVVAKKYRLIDTSNGKFKVNEHRKLERSSVKIGEHELKAYNGIAETSGVYYEIDKKATEERNETINGKTEPKLDRALLKKEADSMGLAYAKNIKTDALKELIETNR